MSATILTREDLQSFKFELLEDIKTIIGHKVTSLDTKWLRSREVRDLLKISPTTLQTLRINGTLPFTKMGTTIYYDIDDIKSILEKRKTN